MKIRWKTGARVKCPASTAYRFLERVREECGGDLNIDEVIRQSRPKDAPLHNDLTWDKDAALVKVQREEVRYLVRSIEVVRADLPAPVRAYESISVEPIREESEPPRRVAVFRRTEDILADPAGRAELLSQAVRDALAFRKRYAALSELATLISVIDEQVAKLA